MAAATTATTPPTPTPTVDLLIVGGGPVGLTAAIESQRLGLSFRIVERRAERSTRDSRAVVVHPRMMELLAMHPSVNENIMEHGYKNEGAHIDLVADDVTISVKVADSNWGDTEFPQLWLHPQYYTEKYLEECLRDEGAGGGGNENKVEYGVTFEGLTQTDNDVVTATVRHASGKLEEITAKYVMAADGARSKVRESVGINLDRTHADSAFVVADLKLLGENSPCRKLPGVHVMLTKDGMFLLLPLPDDVLRAYYQVPAGTKKEDITLDEAFFEEQLLEMANVECKVELGPWQTIFDITYGVSDAYRKGRVFLAGDAAHVHSPVGGQGMNYGMWDAVTLTSKLAWAERVLAKNPDATDAVEDIFESYSQERHSMGEELISTVQIATIMVSSRNRFLQKARNAVMRVGVPYVSKDMFRTMAQLDLKYKPSFSQFIVPVAGWFKYYITYPGHRLPDLVLSDGSKLYQKVDRTRFTWIFCNAEAPDGGAEGGKCISIVPATEQSSVPAIAETTLAKSQVILVRPDLFVAAVDESYENLSAAVRAAFGDDCFAAL